MIESESLAHWFTFTSDEFDHSSNLRRTRFRGNGFYGRDVAEFLSAGLNARGLESSVFDEDFGWMVHAPLPDDGVLVVGVYHNPEGVRGTESDWALKVESLTKGKRLAVVPRVRGRETDPGVLAKLEDVFRQAGIRLRRRDEP